mmetsp:Transcript_23882/g.37366  ORF Transcript_23882/g.37366 Transcript_23882/m.37366 type:complete len:236 (+) Transcript_23882:45-752(+)
MPWRVKTPGSIPLLSNCSAMLHQYPVVGIESWFPLPCKPGMPFKELLSGCGNPLVLSPMVDRQLAVSSSVGRGFGSQYSTTSDADGAEAPEIFRMASVLRGVPKEGMDDKEAKALLLEHLNREGNVRSAHLHTYDYPVPLPMSFPPNLFDPAIGRDGMLSVVPGDSVEPARIPVLANLKATSALVPWFERSIEALGQGLRSAQIRSVFEEAGIGAEDTAELRERLEAVRDSYSSD